MNIKQCLIGFEQYSIGGKYVDLATSENWLELKAQGSWRFKWNVVAGANTITIDVKQAVNGSPRPRMTVKANPAIGINADVSSSAPSGVDFVTIPTITVNPTSAGAVEVVLEALYNTTSDSTYWKLGSMAVTQP